MSLTRTIARNTIIQLVGRTVSTVLGLITLGMLTRYLGTIGFGKFTTATSFLQFFGILVDFGLTMTTVQMVSEPGVDRGRIASNLFSLRILSGVVFFLLAPLIVLFFPYPADVKTGVLVGTVSFLFIAINQVLTGLLQIDFRMDRAAFADVLGRVALFFSVIATMYFHLGLYGTILSLAAGNIVTAWWNWLLVKKLVAIRWRIDLEVWKSIIYRSWPIGVSIALNLIYLKGDVIVLSFFRSEEEVGLYGASYKVLDVISAIPIMFMGLVLPLLVKTRGEGNDLLFKRFLQRSFDGFSLIAMPFIAGAIVIGGPVMALVAGESFRGSGDILAILSIAGGSVFFGSLFGHTIVAIQKQYVMTWGYAIDALISLAAYLVFIPRYGTIGAAWVTVFSELFIALATYAVVYRATKFIPNLAITAKSAAASAIMMAALMYFSFVHVLIRVLIGGAVFTICAVLMKAVTPELIREIFLPKKQPA